TSALPAPRLSCRRLVGGCKAAQQLQSLLGRGTGLGGECEHEPVRVGRELHRLIPQLKVPDLRMVNALHAGPVVPHIMARPTVAKSVRASDQLANQVRKPLVQRILPSVGAQSRNDVIGVRLPVWEKQPRSGTQER